MTKLFDDIMTTDNWLCFDERPDFILSNWVFVWFVLYYLRVIKQSPFLVLIVGFVVNTYEYITTNKGKCLAWKLQYIIRNFFIKIIPILLIFYSKDNGIKWKKGLITIGLFYAVFLCWIYINRWFGSPVQKPQNPFNFNKKTKE